MLRRLPLRMFGLMCAAIAFVIGLSWWWLDASSSAHTQDVLLGVSALSATLAALLSLLLARWVSQPLGEIVGTADRLASGDLSVRTRARRQAMHVGVGAGAQAHSEAGQPAGGTRAANDKSRARSSCPNCASVIVNSAWNRFCSSRTRSMHFLLPTRQRWGAL